MNEIQQAALEFHNANPYANERQAAEAADIEFGEYSDQREFVAFWKKLHEQAANIRRSQLKSDADRNWPEKKGY